jgi:peroxiredoxin
VQLVELQNVLPTLRDHDFALFAISYDPVSALADFAQRNGIQYPLLGDEGSQVIRALGMLDEDLETHHAQFGGQVRDEQRGVCYPGVFVLDEQGVVLERRFQRNYRVRESGLGLLAALLGTEEPAESSARQADDSPLVRISARLDSPTYWRYQRLRVIVDVAIAPGAHVFAPGSPPDYTPLSVEVTADRAVIGEPESPASIPFELNGLDQDLQVYEGAARINVPLEFVTERGEPMGDRSIAVRVRYQACDEATCYPPVEAVFQLTASPRPDVS